MVKTIWVFCSEANKLIWEKSLLQWPSAFNFYFKNIEEIRDVKEEKNSLILLSEKTYEKSIRGFIDENQLDSKVSLYFLTDDLSEENIEGKYKNIYLLGGGKRVLDIITAFEGEGTEPSFCGKPWLSHKKESLPPIIGFLSCGVSSLATDCALTTAKEELDLISYYNSKDGFNCKNLYLSLKAENHKLYNLGFSETDDNSQNLVEEKNLPPTIKEYLMFLWSLKTKNYFMEDFLVEAEKYSYIKVPEINPYTKDLERDTLYELRKTLQGRVNNIILDLDLASLNLVGELDLLVIVDENKELMEKLVEAVEDIYGYSKDKCIKVLISDNTFDEKGLYVFEKEDFKEEYIDVTVGRFWNEYFKREMIDLNG